jgi:galactose mutarotase-like enzyme
MIYTAHSSGYSLSVKPHGAELCSLRAPDGTEFIWQADPEYWPRHAPNLFPVVGRLRNDAYVLDGRRYALKQHGFARDLDFSLSENAPGRLAFRLNPTDETRARYPFEFCFDVLYHLEGGALSVTYQVANQGSRPMPFCVGAHPAFGCSWQSGDTLADYYLAFEQPEVSRTHLLDGGLLTTETLPLMDNRTELALGAHTFDRDALILLDHASRAVTLQRRGSRRSVTVRFPGFPHLGIWSKPGAPFVCIEPWIGHADASDAAGDLFAKPGVVVLDTGRIFSATYTIIVSEG